MENLNQNFIIGFEEKDGYLEVYLDNGEITAFTLDFKDDILKRMTMQKDLFPDYFMNITAKIKIDNFLKTMGLLSSGILTIISIDTFFYARFSSIMALFLAAMLTKCYEFSFEDKKKNILYRKFAYYFENKDIFDCISLESENLFTGLNSNTIKIIKEHIKESGKFNLNIIRKLEFLDLIKIVRNYQSLASKQKTPSLLYKEAQSGNK